MELFEVITLKYKRKYLSSIIIRFRTLVISMVRVSKEWIKNNVANIIDSTDGSRLKNHILGNIRVPSGGFETDLSADQVIVAEGRKTDFKIKIPGQYGWCSAQTYSAENRPKTWTPSRGIGYFFGKRRR